MIRGAIALVLIIFLLSNISAFCNETQIDINTANSTELDKIKWVGPATAQNIINYRQNNQFDSVDELLNVSGIGQTKLSDIKAEGLACVEEAGIENESNEIIIDNETPEQTNNYSTAITTPNIASNTPKKNSSGGDAYTPKPTTKAITLDKIDLNSLNSKDIKSEDNKEILKKNLALGGIVTFCLLFGALFFLKSAGRKENEFR